MKSVAANLTTRCDEESVSQYLDCSHYIDVMFAILQPGDCFSNGIPISIDIPGKARLAIMIIIPFLAIVSLQTFAHAMTAWLSCHVQNFVAIAVIERRWE